jgi:hypothetical protein
MAKQRMINTKFWSDPWVMTKLNSLDRLLFLYLITNELTNISGIYEISEHRIAFDTGVEKDTLIKAMIPRLEPKVYYHNNWIIIVSFPKHQNLKSKDVVEGIRREFLSAPLAVQKEAMDRGWGDGLGIAPDTKPNLTKLISETKVSQEFTFKEEKEDADAPEKTERIAGKEKDAYESMCKWAEAQRGSRFVHRLKQYKALKDAKLAGIKSAALKERWEEMSVDKFFSKNGFDWTNVVSSFDRKGV